MDKVNAKLLLTKSYSTRIRGWYLLITEISLRQMLEVLLYTMVSELLEFVARSDCRDKYHQQVERKIRHEQVLKTIDNNVHSKIPNLMMDAR